MLRRYHRSWMDEPQRGSMDEKRAWLVFCRHGCNSHHHGFAWGSCVLTALPPTRMANTAGMANPDRQAAPTEADATVIVIDDDPGLREALGGLLRSVGLRARLLASVPEFLKSGRPKGPTCLVLDVRLPGRSGLDFQRELAAAGIRLPIIFVTGHGDIPMSVQAMKGGAIEFLTKPFRDQDLLDAIQVGLMQDKRWLESETALADLRNLYETLTPRERQVMRLVVAGRLNKQIAGDIGVSEITVKVHRGQVMRKMHAASLPDLARMAEKLKLLPQEHSKG